MFVEAGKFKIKILTKQKSDENSLSEDHKCFNCVLAYWEEEAA